MYCAHVICIICFFKDASEPERTNIFVDVHSTITEFHVSFCSFTSSSGGLRMVFQTRNPFSKFCSSPHKTQHLPGERKTVSFLKHVFATDESVAHTDQGGIDRVGGPKP